MLIDPVRVAVLGAGQRNVATQHHLPAIAFSELHRVQCLLAAVYRSAAEGAAVALADIEPPGEGP